MSLLTVLLVVAALIVCCALIALLDSYVGPKLAYPRYVIHFAYGLVILIAVLFICRELGIWSLLNSVRV